MARKTSFLVVLVSLAVAGCVDPSKVVEVVESVADKAEQVSQVLIPDTHEALYGAMLDCQDKGADIVEGLTDIQAAREAQPRLRALGKQYRHLAHRYLLLELPDVEEAKRLNEAFKEREQKLALRGYELAKRLSEGDKNLLLAIGTASSPLSGARSAFQLQLSGLVMEKTLGEKMPLPPDDTSPADLDQQEKMLRSAAAKLNKVTDSLEAAIREGSIQSRLEAMRAQADDFLRDVDKVADLPPPKRMKYAIRLDPAREQVEDAVLHYAEASGAAHHQKNESWRGFIAIDFDIIRGTQKLEAPQLFKDMEKMLEKGPTAIADEMAEKMKSMKIARPEPGAGKSAPPEFPSRPGIGGGSAPGRPAAPTIPSMPAIEGPDVVTIEIASFPPKMYQQVTQRLTELTSRTNYRASNSGGQYTFSVSWAGDLRELARKIDFGTVTKTDDATRTITVEIPPKS
jgi:hypothetical protein